VGNNRLVEVRSGGGGVGGSAPTYTPHFKRHVVNLQINQRISLEREAFIATMVLEHEGGLPAEEMEVDIFITDEYGTSWIVEPGSGQGGFLITPTIPTELAAHRGKTVHRPSRTDVHGQR
jgi:hypothetical protein